MSTWLSKKTCIDAIGLKYFDDSIKKFFGTGKSFSILPIPKDKNCWLVRNKNKEFPQSFEDFALGRKARAKAESKTYEETKNFQPYVPNMKTRVKKGKDVIYIAYIEENFINNPLAPPLDLLIQYASIYFGLQTKVLDHTQIKTYLEDSELTLRKGSEGQNQYLTGDILEMLYNLLPSFEDAFCILGITMVDLYPQESWNFVLGEANLKKRTGVFSFARYLSKLSMFSNIPPLLDISMEEIKEGDIKMNNDILFKSARVMCHELFHLFYVDHCQYFNKCVMLGSNSVEEENEHSIQLCPVCLAKLLHSNPNIDLMKRYLSLLDFYKKLDVKYKPSFEKDADWLINHLKELQSTTAK